MIVALVDSLSAIIENHHVPSATGISKAAFRILVRTAISEVIEIRCGHCGRG